MESLKVIPFRFNTRSLILRLSCLFFLMATLPRCGHKKSQDIGIAVLPAKPIVITADTRDSFGGTIAAPWFSFRPLLSNGSDSTVTIVALKLSITGMDESGQISTVTREFVPSSFPITQTDTANGVTVTYTCQFTHFGVFASKLTDQQLYLGGDGNCPPCDTNGSGVRGCVPRPVFFFGGGPGGPDKSFTSWSVRMIPLGWFGDYNAPTDRYMGSVTFRTQ